MPDLGDMIIVIFCLSWGAFLGSVWIEKHAFNWRRDGAHAHD